MDIRHTTKLVNFTNITIVEYEIKVYLFACWKLYSILRIIIPGPKNLFANKLFSFFAASME